jgi:VWFA-related protein
MSANRTVRNRSARILFGCCCVFGIIACWSAQDFSRNAIAQSGQSFSLRADVELVAVEVAALDRNGNPAKSLKKENFRLFEDDKQQEILSFDEVTPETAGSLKRPLMDDRDRHRGKTVLIIFDDSSINAAHTKMARDAAETFVKEHMAEQDLFAVASFGYSMNLLQNFTQDREKVLKAIAQPAVSMANPSRPSGGAMESLPNLGRPQDMDPASMSVSYQVEALLQSLQGINASIERLRGQKSALIFSESDYINPKTALKVYGETLKSAKRANVVYYTVDPGGLKSGAGGSAGTFSTNAQGGISIQNLGGQNTDQSASSGSAMSLLKALANDTGGSSIFNTNNYDKELTSLDRQLSNYYILGFRSNNPKHDGSLRRLEIKTDLKGVTLKHKKAYLDRRPIDTLASSKQEGKLLEALASPTSATQLPILFRPAYFYESPSLSKVLVFAEVGMEKAELKKKDNQLESDLNIMGLAYAEDGSIAGRFSEPLHLAFAADKEQEIRKRSITYRNYFRLQPGKYRLKIAVSDEASNLGSLERPLEVPAFPEHGPVASSLVLAAQISRLPELVQNIQTQLLDDSDPLLYNGIQIAPNIYNRFRTGSAIPVLFKLYNLKGSDPLKLQGNARLVGENGEEFLQPIAGLDEKASPTGKSEAVFGFALVFPEAKPGKYKLLIEAREDGAAEATILQTDLELR